MKRIVVTGASGLLGWHALVRLHAANCEAEFRGDSLPYQIVALNHSDFDNDVKLRSAMKNADAVMHYAGVNRGSDEHVRAANLEIAVRLTEACKAVRAKPQIIYANSIHSFKDTVYGRSKNIAGKHLEAFSSGYTNIILPHIFGEHARPHYNNVTATLIHQILYGKPASVNPNGHVHLLHAGEAAQFAINSVKSETLGQLQTAHCSISIPKLYAKLKNFHEKYHYNVFPDVSDALDLSLFNTYRSAIDQKYWPRQLHLNTDLRGSLFEAVKGGGGGQIFLSTTKPGVTRGNHFHLNKIERFLVIRGEAIIRIRKVLSRKILEFRVSGDQPTAIDMPTLHTHSIENVGTEELITLFWTHELFDPKRPDTYADKVIQ